MSDEKEIKDTEEVKDEAPAAENAPEKEASAKKVTPTKLALAIAAFLCPNSFLRGVSFETLAQARLAKFIHPGATVLQYSHLDDGLYLASGTLPEDRYFCLLNADIPEMDAGLEESVMSARNDYVLTAWERLPERFDRYQLIAEDVGYDDRGRLNKMLYLYRRK